MFAQLHSTSNKDMPVAVHFDTQLWPWNTQLRMEHLYQPLIFPFHKPVFARLGMNTTIEEEFAFMEQMAQEANSPTVFWYDSIVTLILALSPYFNTSR